MSGWQFSIPTSVDVAVLCAPAIKRIFFVSIDVSYLVATRLADLVDKIYRMSPSGKGRIPPIPYGYEGTKRKILSTRCPWLGGR